MFEALRRKLFGPRHETSTTQVPPPPPPSQPYPPYLYPNVALQHSQFAQPAIPPYTNGVPHPQLYPPAFPFPYPYATQHGGYVPPAYSYGGIYAAPSGYPLQAAGNGVGPPNPMFNHPLQIPPQGTLAPTGQTPGAVMGVPIPLQPSPAPTNSVKPENPDGSDDKSLVKEEKNTDDEEGTTPSIPPLIHDLIVIFSQTTRGA
ncbi:hypothetical protein CPB85DRAFT_1298207 [Mucidula mucida]|nr:hypothetical protein CPB85DRAFT_1298207 [Mucidula mucida]